MSEITVDIPASNKVPYDVLRKKIDQLHARGIMDAGLVLVQSHSSNSVPILQGYISQSELEFGLTKLCPPAKSLSHPTSPSLSESPTLTSTPHHPQLMIRLLGHLIDGDTVAPETLEVDLTPFVDRTPLTICAKAPLEYAVEMFSKLGLRYLCVTEEGTGRLVGVVIKKRLVGFLEALKEGGGEE